MRVLADHGLTSRTILPNGIKLADVWPPTTRPVTLAVQIPGYLTAPPDPILVDTKRQLFADDFMIAATTMTRTFYQGVQYGGNPVLDKATPPRVANPISDGCWIDPADGLWKFWYMSDRSADSQFNDTNLATSTDGKTFIYPDWGVVPGTNVVLDLEAVGRGRDSCCVWMDLEAPAAQKWKMMQTQYTLNQSPRDVALRLYYSSDGIHWGSPVATSAVLTVVADRHTFFRNSFRSKWVLSLRDILTPVGRMRRYLEGTDLVAMVNGLTDITQAVPWVCSDTLDPPLAGSDLANPAIYAIDCVPYESVLLGLITVIDAKSGPAGGEADHVELGISRDGFSFDRTSRLHVAFSTNSLTDSNNGVWNSHTVQSVGGCVMDVGTETWMYTSGRSNVAYQAGLWIFRKNGFASLDSGAAEAATYTRYQRVTDLTCSKLFVNVNAAGGSLKAEVQDGFGVAIPGFTKALCNAVTTDSADVQVTWSGSPSLQPYMGQRLRLVFYGTSSKLYAYRFSP